jgi:hypothetical protein
MIYGNTPWFLWCQLVTVADTQNDGHGTQTYSQPTLSMEHNIGVDCLSELVPLVDF